MAQLPPGESPRWLDDRRNVDRVFYLLLAACGAVVAVDLGAYHKHGHFDFENYPAFHAIFGFVAYVGLITLAKGLRKLVMRPEDYYGESAPEAGSEDAAPSADAAAPQPSADEAAAPSDDGDHDGGSQRDGGSDA